MMFMRGSGLQRYNFKSCMNECYSPRDSEGKHVSQQRQILPLSQHSVGKHCYINPSLATLNLPCVVPLFLNLRDRFQKHSGQKKVRNQFFTAQFTTLLTQDKCPNDEKSTKPAECG